MSTSSRMLLALFAVLSVGGVIEYALTDPGASHPFVTQGTPVPSYVASVR